MNPHPRFLIEFQSLLTPLVVMPFLAIGCAGSSYVGSSIAGRMPTYQPGLPNFEMETIASWKEGKPGIDVYLNIPYRSVSFVRVSSGFAAAFTTSAQVETKEGQQLVTEQEWVDSVNVDTYEATQRLEAMTLTKRVSVAPGVYQITISVNDRTTRKGAVRSQDLEVFSLDSGKPQLTDMWLEGATGTGQLQPVVMLHVPSNIDSLQTVSLLYNAEGASRANAELFVVRLLCDTSVALQPYVFSSPEGSLVARGIDHEKHDTVSVQRKELSPLLREMPIVFRLPALGRGVYLLDERVTVLTAADAKDSVVLNQRYDLAVNGVNFPRPSTLDELIEALPYVAREGELQAMTKAQTTQEKRREFELFWLKLGGSQQGAANLIKQYYSRVQEANMLFTTYKEGWKTDRGMVYIVMGPPASVSTRLNREYWMYGYDEQDVTSLYIFERSGNLGLLSVFPNYVLVHQPYYTTNWERQVNRWRTGSIQ